MTKEQLQEALGNLPLADVKVSVLLEGRRFIGIVDSPTFEGMDEAERQRLVWHHLRERFGDDPLVQIEFVFTNTPQETAELAS